MPDFVPVEHDPFAHHNVQLTPVDYNPFSTKESGNTIESNLFDAAKHRYHLASQGVENAPDPNEPNSKGINRLFGLQGEERYQTFPEKTIRSIYDAMYDPSLDPSHGVQPPSETVIEGAFNAAGLAGGAPLGMRAGTASLGSGMVRPIMNANKNEVPAFYSAVENAVNGINQPKMTGQQWLGTLANKPGVKPEEMGWTGLDNFLKKNADKSLTKQEVQDFVKGNKVELKEVNKADISDPVVKYLNESFGPATKYIQTSKDIADARKFNSAFRETTKGMSDEEVLAAARKSEEYEKVGDTKYHNYQLPGGENYRETLLTLPSKKTPAQRYQELNDIADKRSLTDVESTEMVALERGLSHQGSQSAGNMFVSSHWDEPNVLAHVRMNDRVINGDKSLHIEEIQSDWHQAGRQRGYQNGMPIAERQKAIENKLDEIIANRIKNNNPGEHQQEYESLYNELINNQKAEAAERKGVPDAPFKKTWHELVLKRMIREAAEKGYDKLSWTPGEAQAARYDLSKQINELNVERLQGKDEHLYEVAGKDKKGEPFNLGVFKPNELPNVIGKDMSDKIINEPKHKQSYQGLDLKVGGEGMKGFYDQIIPKALEKITGEKVKTTPSLEVAAKELKDFESQFKSKPIPEDKKVEWNKLRNNVATAKQPVHYIDIPQKLKDTAMQKGFPLFSGGGHMLTPVDHDPFNRDKK